MSDSHDYSLYALRRKDLLAYIKEENPSVKRGALVLCASFEENRYRFRQESSFYYLTGITEPGAIAVIDLSGKSILYVPAFNNRSAWVHNPLHLSQENAKKLGFDALLPLGEVIKGYQLFPYSDKRCYTNVLTQLDELVKNKGTIFTLLPHNSNEYTQQYSLINYLHNFIPQLLQHCINIAPMVAAMRRKKDILEIEHLYKAVELTILAQGAAAQAISDGMTECEVQASLEYMFTGSCAQPAFPSIVASGQNATILHYTSNASTLKNGHLVVVDIGADFNYYCADLTRTYPVSGVFTKRQKELYNIVLETQEYIAQLAKPGMWLNNKDNPDQSLHHQAKKFLDECGYGKYFIHGIGHFLGIDVHDVGDVNEPLKDGDVFTIEPGIYIPEENIGIRIEDNYWMAKESLICLSESLQKKVDDVENLMQESFDDDQDESESDQDFDLAQS